MANRKKNRKKNSNKNPIFLENRVTYYVQVVIGIIIAGICHHYAYSVNKNYEDQNDIIHSSKDDESSRNDHETCQYYLAKSTIENSGNGIFTTVPIRKGSQVGSPDVVIHMPDIDPRYAEALRMILYNYAWDGEKVEGQYEGQKVFSLVPGVGALANGHQTMFNTDEGSGGPSVDHGGLVRGKSPGAGAISHYHDYSFIATRDIEAGGEILMNFGMDWFKERESKGLIHSPDDLLETSRSIEWLRKNGVCVDNIRVGPSTKKHAGRGAFTKRAIQKGEIVSPVPILQILDRKALDGTWTKEDGTEEKKKQLLLNYCYGHRNSSLLFFPYSPLVNFINHDHKNPNIELRWPESNLHSIPIENLKIDDLKAMKHAGLALELVATRNMHEGEELFLSYGEAWEKAWENHMRNCNDQSFAEHDGTASYAHEYDKKYSIIYTQQEQQRDPSKRYPDEQIFLSCYYNYSDSMRKNRKRGNMYLWTKSKSILKPENLRPCVVLDRHENQSMSKTFYTVGILNRFGLHEAERIPSGQQHIVTGVPRYAMRFSSKLYSTDQHFHLAFRNEIELSDALFPQQWTEV